MRGARGASWRNYRAWSDLAPDSRGTAAPQLSGFPDCCFFFSSYTPEALQVHFPCWEWGGCPPSQPPRNAHTWLCSPTAATVLREIGNIHGETVQREGSPELDVPAPCGCQGLQSAQETCGATQAPPALLLPPLRV